MKMRICAHCKRTTFGDKAPCTMGAHYDAIWVFGGKFKAFKFWLKQKITGPIKKKVQNMTEKELIAEVIKGISSAIRKKDGAIFFQATVSNRVYNDMLLASHTKCPHHNYEKWCDQGKSGFMCGVVPCQTMISTGDGD